MREPMRQTDWYALVVILVSSLSLGAAGVWYTNHVQREADRKWCSIVVAQSDAYRLTPPTSPTGQRVAAAIDRLRVELDCPPS